MSRVKNHVARSNVKVTVHTLTVCAWASCVQPITSSGMVGGQGHNWHFKFVRSRTVSDPSSCLVGFENYLAEMIITTRRCVACKNHFARSKVRVTVGT